jgi:hypothetical protein
MEVKRPVVKSAFPVGDSGLRPVPKSLNAYDVLNNEEIWLRDPFRSGPDHTLETPGSITYAKLATGCIVESNETSDPEPKSRDNQEIMRVLHVVSNTFWPTFQSTYHRMASMPKHDDGWRQQITPDLGIVVTKPKRKIEGPKNTRKRPPPKPGGK